MQQHSRKYMKEGYYVGRSFIICDKEEGYAQALAAFFLRKKELALQIQVCSSPEQAAAIQEEQEADILIIHDAWPMEERRKVRAENRFVLDGIRER